VKADTGMTTESSSSEVEAVTEVVSDKPKEESVMAPPSFVFGRSLESRVEKVNFFTGTDFDFFMRTFHLLVGRKEDGRPFGLNVRFSGQFGK
jgi:hypothetical protein